MNEKHYKRLMKCLRSVERHKYSDFDGVFMLADEGYITMEGPSDDIEIKITEKGRIALDSKIVLRSILKDSPHD